MDDNEGTTTSKSIEISNTPSRENSPVVPIVRSLSMSRNLAESIVDNAVEVPHMIHLNSNEIKKQTIKKSSSASSLSRLLLLSSSPNDNDGLNSSLNLSSRFLKSNTTQEAMQKSQQASLMKNKSPTLATSPDHTSSSSKFDFEPESLADSIAKLEMKSLTHEKVKHVIGGKRNDLLVGIVVSRWCNIVGPQCVYLWTEERTSSFYPTNLPHHLSRLVKYVTDHTVDHHDIVDGNLVLPSTLRSTICIVRDLNLAYLSVSIRVPSDPDSESSSYGFSHLADRRNRPASTVPHSVAVLANLHYLSQFLLLRPLILNWLSEFAPKIGVLLCKDLLQSSMINSWCAEICKTISATMSCWRQDSPAKSFEQIHLSHLTSSAFESNDPSEYLPPNFLNKTVLETLLTSYLLTFGSAIIVGEDANLVNQVIRFLLCFAKNQEAYCSRYVLPTLPDTFMKGLFVQGLMLGEIGAKSISSNQVGSNRYPFTYMELSKKSIKIKQTNLLLHRQQRENILRDELYSLWNSNAFISPSTDPFPCLVKEGSTFVSKFLDELSLLRPERRYAHLLLFKRKLHAKAIALIVYLESIRLKPPKDRLKLLKTIPQALGFDDLEYSIAQVAAERIRPGILPIIRTKQFNIS